MADSKKNASTKRTKQFRDCKQSNDFLKDWERLERSGKHDMHRIKEAMLLLAANDAPLPPEWKDHKLNGDYEDVRECHVKGDLLLLYRLYDIGKVELITFMRAGTHSEIFP